jgi:hypothetical protein
MSFPRARAFKEDDDAFARLVVAGGTPEAAVRLASGPPADTEQMPRGRGKPARCSRRRRQKAAKCELFARYFV